MEEEKRKGEEEGMMEGEERKGGGEGEGTYSFEVHRVHSFIHALHDRQHIPRYLLHKHVSQQALGIVP